MTKVDTVTLRLCDTYSWCNIHCTRDTRLSDIMTFYNNIKGSNHVFEKDDDCCGRYADGCATVGQELPGLWLFASKRGPM